MGLPVKENRFYSLTGNGGGSWESGMRQVEVEVENVGRDDWN